MFVRLRDGRRSQAGVVGLEVSTQFTSQLAETLDTKATEFVPLFRV